MTASHGLYISAGLLSAQHRARIGPAIWEFLWLISHETRQAGKVLNGAPITAVRIAEELGEHFQTVLTHLRKLERQGYISRKLGPGKIYSYSIANSKKWARVSDNAQSDLAKSLSQNDRNHSVRLSENCKSNKEVDNIDIVDIKPSAKSTRGESSNPSQSDSRHSQVREFTRQCYEKANPNLPAMPWDGRTARTLQNLLRANPSWAAEKLCECVVHRFESMANHAEQPSRWIPKLLSYAAGPLDQYGKPKAANNGKLSLQQIVERETAILGSKSR